MHITEHDRFIALQTRLNACCDRDRHDNETLNQLAGFVMGYATRNPTTRFARELRRFLDARENALTPADED